MQYSRFDDKDMTDVGAGGVITDDTSVNGCKNDNNCQYRFFVCGEGVISGITMKSGKW